jgi:hypothetical protein
MTFLKSAICEAAFGGVFGTYQVLGGTFPITEQIGRVQTEHDKFGFAVSLPERTEHTNDEIKRNNPRCE